MGPLSPGEHRQAAVRTERLLPQQVLDPVRVGPSLAEIQHSLLPDTEVNVEYVADAEIRPEHEARQLPARNVPPRVIAAGSRALSAGASGRPGRCAAEG
jgi:hypothetical protein